ncbi:MAG: hypothetical protein J6U13_06655 [Salinivirgaceae bacterium]|nr:hypothetical protein [Salinivirgaceae bacterium]
MATSGFAVICESWRAVFTQNADAELYASQTKSKTAKNKSVKRTIIPQKFNASKV